MFGHYNSIFFFFPLSLCWYREPAPTLSLRWDYQLTKTHKRMALVGHVNLNEWRKRQKIDITFGLFSSFDGFPLLCWVSSFFSFCFWRCLLLLVISTVSFLPSFSPLSSVFQLFLVPPFSLFLGLFADAYDRAFCTRLLVFSFLFLTAGARVRLWYLFIFFFV